MTKLKLTPAFIKKFRKFDEEGKRLVDVWTKRHSAKKDFNYDEEKMMKQASGMPKFSDELKPQGFQKFEKVSESRNIVANVYGKSPHESSTKFTILSGKEDRILKRGRKIQEESEGRFVNRLRSAYKNVALKDPGKFTSKPGRIKQPTITRFAPDTGKYGLKSKLVTSPKIGETIKTEYHLPKSDKFYEGYKRSMVISRQKNKPTMILTKGIGEGRKPAGFIGPMQKYTGVGKKDYISGQELKLRYDRLSEKAFVHAAAKKEVFLEKARQRGYTFKNVSDKEKSFMRYKGKFKATDEAAEQMGFPEKSPGGQFMPFNRLDKWNPTKDPAQKILDDADWEKINKQKYMLGVVPSKVKGKPPVLHQVNKHLFSKDHIETTYVFPKKQKTAWDRLSKAGQYAAKKEEFYGKAKLTARLKRPQTKHILYPHEARKELGWLRQLDKAQAKKKKTPFDW